MNLSSPLSNKKIAIWLGVFLVAAIVAEGSGNASIAFIAGAVASLVSVFLTKTKVES